MGSHLDELFLSVFVNFLPCDRFLDVTEDNVEMLVISV